MLRWRLGLDLGTNSIGWWAFEVTKLEDGERTRWKPIKSLDGGVCIFSEGREPSKRGRVGDSLAVGRRLARGMRRNRDHGKSRIRALVQDLTELGLLPENADERRQVFQTSSDDPDRYNPYRLRAEALERTLEPWELGRALFHLGLRRGYKSNRKEASDDDGGKLKERIDALRSKLGNRTVGQYLWETFQKEQARQVEGKAPRGIRFRGDDEFYPDRAMYAQEFEAIRERQAPDHDLGPADWDRLRDKRILFQWPLRPVERGACEFFIDQPRHWKDTPIGHDFRIYQELNTLRWIDGEQVSHVLNAYQRMAVLDLLMTRKSEVKFKALHKLKRADKTNLFPPGSCFNLEDAKRKGLNPHRLAAQMADDPELANLWAKRDNNATLDDVFTTLHAAPDDAQAIAQLTSDWGVSEAAAEALVKIPLTSGTANVSRKFMECIVPILRDQGLVYSDAVAELTDEDGNPLHHSLRDDGRRWGELPYYGEVFPQSMLGADPSADPKQTPEKHFGKINNPTVHVALNQLRKLVNVLVERFGGPPVEVHVELTRDLKLPRKRRDEIVSEQGKHQRENERIKKDICAPLGITDPSARDLKKVKLWEELGEDGLARRCVFSGQTISAADLFNGEAETEHILPFSRTLDNSMANLTVAKRWANRLKGNDTPYEAFAAGARVDQGIVWDEILQRVETLPKNKSWRFSPTAMERYEKDGGFIARQLNDTAYMARVATRFLGALKGVERVVTNPGRLTALVRGKWRLNGILSDDNIKTREDHRHHAVDAAVIALTDRAVLQEVSRLTARGADDLVHLAVPDLDEVLETGIRETVRNIVVAYRPDHGLQGQMYSETAYGFVAEDRRDPELKEHNLVTRKELASLTPKECEAIRDPGLRMAVREWLYEAKGAGVKHDKALIAFGEETGVKRVRILVRNQSVALVPSAPFKGYAIGSYVCCDVWKMPKGEPGNWRRGEYKWKGIFWPYAETVGGLPDSAEKKPHPAAKFVTRLFKDDVIAIEEGGQMEILRIGGFSTTDNKLDVRPQHASDPDRKFVSINVLGPKGLRRLHITPDGRILSGRRKKLS